MNARAHRWAATLVVLPVFRIRCDVRKTAIIEMIKASADEQQASVICLREVRSSATSSRASEVFNRQIVYALHKCTALCCTCATVKLGHQHCQYVCAVRLQVCQSRPSNTVVTHTTTPSQRDALPLMQSLVRVFNSTDCVQFSSSPSPSSGICFFSPRMLPRQIRWHCGQGVRVQLMPSLIASRLDCCNAGLMLNLRCTDVSSHCPLCI